MSIRDSLVASSSSMLDVCMRYTGYLHPMLQCSSIVTVAIFFVVHGASGFYVNRVNRVLWAWFCDTLSLPLP